MFCLTLIDQIISSINANRYFLTSLTVGIPRTSALRHALELPKNLKFLPLWEILWAEIPYDFGFFKTINQNQIAIYFLSTTAIQGTTFKVNVFHVIYNETYLFLFLRNTRTQNSWSMKGFAYIRISQLSYSSTHAWLIKNTIGTERPSISVMSMWPEFQMIRGEIHLQ